MLHLGLSRHTDRKTNMFDLNMVTHVQEELGFQDLLSKQQPVYLHCMGHHVSVYIIFHRNKSRAHPFQRHRAELAIGWTV